MFILTYKLIRDIPLFNNLRFINIGYMYKTSYK